MTQINNNQRLKYTFYICLIIVFFYFAGVQSITAANQGLLKAIAGVEEEAPSTIENFDEENVKKTIEVLKKELEIVIREENRYSDQHPVRPEININSKAFRLQSVLSTYERLHTALRKKEGRKNERIHLENKLKTFTAQTYFGNPPYPLSLYDKLLNEKLAVSQQKTNIDLALKVNQRALDTASEKFETTLKDLRKIKDIKIESEEIHVLEKLSIQTEQYEMEEQSAEVVLMLEKVNYQNLKQEQDIASLEISLYDRQVSWVNKHLKFDSNDLEKQMDVIDQERSELLKRLKKIVAEQKEVEDSWIKAQQHVTTSTYPMKKTESETFLKSRDAWRDTYQGVLEQTEKMLSLLHLKEQAWRYRYSLLKGDLESSIIKEKGKEIEIEHQKLNEIIHLQQKYYTTLQAELSLIDHQLSESNIALPVKSYISNEFKAVQKASERLNEYLSFLFSTRELCSRFLFEVTRMSQTAPFHEKWVELVEKLQNIWAFEVWTIDDRPVTVRKLITALIILTIGIAATKFMLKYLRRRILKTAKLQETTSATFLKIFSYTAYFLVILFTLRMVNIPLEAFTFLGGAIAIGVGFGAQNLINNFISGFIIMGERPINIGDLIEVDGILGRVEEVGARCTRIRTGENIDILVPNSSFLEKNITNWTLTNHQIRTSVTVGVIYGSPVREVEALLLKAIKENEKILKLPEPFVLFKDFGDDALIFVVHFWVTTYRIVERRLIESAIRFQIDELFREANIIIAFPQKDVHLDTQRPLELKIMNSDDKPKTL